MLRKGDSKVPSNFVLKLRKIDKNPLPLSTGTFTHAFFYSIIKKTNPDYSKILHTLSSQKPFSLSSIIFNKKTSFYYLDIKTLTDEIFELIIDSILKINNVIKIGNNKFALLEISNSFYSNKYALRISYEEIFKNAIVDDKIYIAFKSPTAFRKKLNDKTILDPSPNPALVFKSLFNRWQKFSSMPFDISLKDFEQKVLPYIYIASLKNISTHAVLFKNTKTKKEYFQIGFTGKVSFSYDIPEEYIKILSTLADFSFFSGVGIKVTYGMGQAKRLIPNKKLNYA